MAGLLPPEEILYEIEHDDDDSTATFITSFVVCFAIAAIAVVLRLIARRLKRLTLEKDDYMAITSLVFAAGIVALVPILIRAGEGKHVIFSADPILFVKTYIAAQVLYIAGVVPVKLSIMFLYARIFPSRRLRLVMCVVGFVVVCSSIAGGFLAIFHCVPIRANWDPTVKSRCVNFKAGVYSHGAQNVLTDFILLGLPMPLIWRLQMPTTRKFQVTGIFAIGCVASIASVARLFYMGHITLFDPTWSNVAPSIWSMVELCMGITCCCLPTMGPIVSYFSGCHSGSMRPQFSRDYSFRCRGSPDNPMLLKDLHGRREATPRFLTPSWLPSLFQTRLRPKVHRSHHSYARQRESVEEIQWKPLPPSPPPFAWIPGSGVKGTVEMSEVRPSQKCSLREGRTCSLHSIQVTTKMVDSSH